MAGINYENTISLFGRRKSRFPTRVEIGFAEGLCFGQEMVNQHVACQVGKLSAMSHKVHHCKFTLQRHLDECISAVYCVYADCRGVNLT